MNKLLPLLALALFSCSGVRITREVKVFERDICGYDMGRDTKHKVCWVNWHQESAILDCAIVEQCLRERETK